MTTRAAELRTRSAQTPAAGARADAAAGGSSRVLVLSAHVCHLDRRIVAQLNTLAASGREATLVSVPVEIPRNCLDPRVRTIVPEDGAYGAASCLKQAVRRMLPEFGVAVLRRLHQTLVGFDHTALLRMFARCTPPASYDVIHCHDLDTLPAAVSLRETLAPRARVIFDAHELYPYQRADRAFQQYWGGVERQYIHRADRVITVNESLADQFVRLYGVRRPAVIYNSYGIDTRREPLSEEAFCAHFGAEKQGFRVLFQGGLGEHRNLFHLVQAFGLLGDAYQLFLLGRGPHEQALLRLKQRLGLSNVWFGGWIPQSDLLRYTARADLGIIPYTAHGDLLNMKYCTPNKLFEFIEAQVPVCVSDLPELARIVRDTRIGGAFPLGSPAEIAAAIRECRRRCEKGEYTARLRAAARERFSWDRQESILLRLYEECAA